MSCCVVLFFFAQEAGSFDAYSASILVAAVQAAAAVVSMGFVDRLGRRALLLASGSAMAVCTGLLGVYFFFKVRGGGPREGFHCPAGSHGLGAVCDKERGKSDG